MPTRVLEYENLIQEFLEQYPPIIGPQYDIPVTDKITHSRIYQRAVLGYIRRFLEKMHEEYNLELDDIMMGISGLLEDLDVLHKLENSKEDK